MKSYHWDSTKNLRLQTDRGVSFEQVVAHIERGDVLADEEHHNKDRYPNQRVLVVRILDYAYLVPYVETDDEVFLKTIIPSRKATNEYLRKTNEQAE